VVVEQPLVSSGEDWITVNREYSGLARPTAACSRWAKR
jgi:hypothetical protein